MEENTPKRKGRPRVANKKKQYTLTLRPDIYEKAMAESEKRGISFSAFVSNLIVEELEKHHVTEAAHD